MLVILSKKDLVIGHTLEAIKFAYDNNYSFVLNSKLKYHSYEEEEEQASEMLWKMSMSGQCIFTNPPVAIEINDNLIVHHPRVKTKILCDKVHVYSADKVSCSEISQEIDYYRVIDWFDAFGDSEKMLDRYDGWGQVQNILSYPTKRIDQKNLKKDIMVEQHLKQESLRQDEYSDTTVRILLTKLLAEKNISVELNLWKRDVYPIEKRFHHVIELNSEV